MQLLSFLGFLPFDRLAVQEHKVRLHGILMSGTWGHPYLLTSNLQDTYR